ncbi:MAG: glycosyltransferase [Lachnospiraceae bacterium]|nr:glycosyltransferase [Lachnospiraceae bacterium]
MGEDHNDIKILKVLHIKCTLNAGGGCMIVYRLAQALKDKYRFDWMTYSLTGHDWAYKFNQIGSVIRYFPGPKGHKYWNNLCLYFKYIKHIRKNGYKIVHLHTEHPSAIRFIICAYFGGAKKRIMHSHNNSAIGVYNNWHTKLRKWLMDIFVTDYIACSKEAAEWLFSPRGARKAVIIKNGLNTELYQFSLSKRTEIRNELGLNDNQYVIGHIGRFVPQKNHIFLLETFQEVLRIDTNARLLLLGSGPMEKEIYEKIKAMGIEKK